jgi:hypothetical protein
LAGAGGGAAGAAGGGELQAAMLHLDEEAQLQMALAASLAAP